MRVITVASVLALAAVPAVAHAGVYGSINVGGASPSSVSTTIYAPSGAIFGGGEEILLESLSRSAAPAPAGSDSIEGDYNVNSAVAISGSLGYDFGLIRAEAEVSYSRHTVRALNVTQLTGFGGDTTTDLQDGAFDTCFYLGVSSCPSSGNSIALDGVKLRQLAGMGNLWLDIPVGGKIEPYVGGGIGVVGLESGGEAKSAFAWQLGAGVAYKLSSHLALTADVRYREVDPIQFDFGGGEGLNFGRVKTTSYGVGLRYSF